MVHRHAEIETLHGSLTKRPAGHTNEFWIPCGTVYSIMVDLFQKDRHENAGYIPSRDVLCILNPVHVYGSIGGSTGEFADADRKI